MVAAYQDETALGLAPEEQPGTIRNIIDANTQWPWETRFASQNLDISTVLESERPDKGANNELIEAWTPTKSDTQTALIHNTAFSQTDATPTLATLPAPTSVPVGPLAEGQWQELRDQCGDDFAGVQYIMGEFWAWIRIGQPKIAQDHNKDTTAVDEQTAVRTTEMEELVMGRPDEAEDVTDLQDILLEAFGEFDDVAQSIEGTQSTHTTELVVAPTLVTIAPETEIVPEIEVEVATEIEIEIVSEIEIDISAEITYEIVTQIISAVESGTATLTVTPVLETIETKNESETETEIASEIASEIVTEITSEIALEIGTETDITSTWTQETSSASIASGRLSYTLGLHGPCTTYNSACSVALVASHVGLHALQLGEYPDSLALTVDLMLTPAAGASFAVAEKQIGRDKNQIEMEYINWDPNGIEYNFGCDFDVSGGFGDFGILGGFRGSGGYDGSDDFDGFGILGGFGGSGDNPYRWGASGGETWYEYEIVFASNIYPLKKKNKVAQAKRVAYQLAHGGFDGKAHDAG